MASAVVPYQADWPSSVSMAPAGGMFGCRGPSSGVVRTLRRARRIWGPVGKHSCLKNPGAWAACAGAFLSESGSSHQRSMGAGSHLWLNGMHNF